MTPKLRWFLAAFAVTLPLDQGTKLWIASALRYGERVVVIPGIFDLTHVRNPGGSFSFFAHGPYAQRMLLFVGVTCIGIVMLLAFLRRLEPELRLAPLALGMILGGALGNLIDRLAYDGVVDWIDVFLWGGYPWPTFNIADSVIIAGVGLLLLESFLGAKPEPEPEPAADPNTDASPRGSE